MRTVFPREKILTYGPPGSGKSRAWLAIAARFPSSTIWVLDTDDAARRMLASRDLDSPAQGLTNVEVFDCRVWPDYTTSVERIVRQSEPGDWLVVDFISSAWEAVQNHFANEVFNQQLGDYFLEARKSMKANAKRLDGLSGWTDWVVIKAMYQQFMRMIRYELSEVHVYATSPVKTWSGDENKDIREIFQGFRGYPAGEKSLAHEFHTIAFLERSREGWLFSTVKDRERPLLDREPLKDFGLQYVRKVADVKPQRKARPRSGDR